MSLFLFLFSYFIPLLIAAFTESRDQGATAKIPASLTSGDREHTPRTLCSLRMQFASRMVTMTGY